MRQLYDAQPVPGVGDAPGRPPRLRRGGRHLARGRRGQRLRQGLPRASGHDALVKVVDFRSAGRKTVGAGRAADRRDAARPRLRRGRPRRRPALERRPGRSARSRCTAPAGANSGRDSVFVVTGAAGSIVSAITADLAAAVGRHVPPARPDAGARPRRPGSGAIRRGPRRSRVRPRGADRGRRRAADAGADRAGAGPHRARSSPPRPRCTAVETAGGTAPSTTRST